MMLLDADNCNVVYGDAQAAPGKMVQTVKDLAPSETQVPAVASWTFLEKRSAREAVRGRLSSLPASTATNVHFNSNTLELAREHLAYGY